MNNFTVIFTNNTGKMAFTITAESEMDAIKQAVENDLVSVYYSIEVVRNYDYRQ